MASKVREAGMALWKSFLHDGGLPLFIFAAGALLFAHWYMTERAEIKEQEAAEKAGRVCDHRCCKVHVQTDDDLEK